MDEHEIMKVKGSCAVLPGNLEFKRIFKAVVIVLAMFAGLSYMIDIKARK